MLPLRTTCTSIFRQRLALTALILFFAISQSAVAQTYTVLYNFTQEGSNPGVPPPGSLVIDSAGNLYGDTGNVPFKFSPSTGVYTALCAPEGIAVGNVALDASGNLYLATWADVGGFLYKVDAGGCAMLFHFGVPEGSEPTGVAVDALGDIFGTTYQGGPHPCSEGKGCGVLYEFSAQGSETILHAFNAIRKDGWNPISTPLLDSSGNIYGVTSASGGGNGGGNGEAGMIYRYSPDGSIIKIYPPRDLGPSSGLSPDGLGNYYYASGHQVVRVNPRGTLHIIVTLADPVNGGFAFDGKGNIYVVTSQSIVKIDSKGNTADIYSFNDAGGNQPVAGLTFGPDGSLYGTTVGGGTDGYGVIYKLTP